MKRVCLISAVVVACLTLAVYAASRIDTPPPPASITTIAARSAADFVSQQMGVPNSSYPSSWTDTHGPPGSPGVPTGKVVVRGNCAAVDFKSSSGPQTAFIRHYVRHDHAKWVPENVITGSQLKRLNSTAQTCS